MTAVYLSPHYDDICFSLGMTAQRRGGGQLVNVFTTSNYLDGKLAPAEQVTPIRDAEDRAFAEASGLERHNLGLAEATVEGFHPFDLAGIEKEVDALEQPLIGLLQGMAATKIYCPLGVGRHRNHLSVFLAVVKSFATLREKATIYFYEDLPYASCPAPRMEALKRFAYYFPNNSVSRQATILKPDETAKKMALVGLYKSQHPQGIRQEEFSPADPQTPVPHEGYWEVHR